MITGTHIHEVGAARRVSRMGTFKAGLALAVACLVANPARPDTITNIPGGYVHTWTGDHGETFQVTRTFNDGKSVTKVDRHDGKGLVPFVTPPKPPISRPFSGSLYNPDTDQTTTIVRGPNSSVRTVETGNTLSSNSFAEPARPILANGDFESPGGDVRQRIAAGDIPGWTYTPGQDGQSYEIYESDNHDGLTAAGGNHYISFGHNGTAGGSISQTFVTQPGVTYRVTYFVAEQQGDEPRQVIRAVLINGDQIVTRNNQPLKPKFRAGAPIVFTARTTSARLTFTDATPSSVAAYPNLALDRVVVAVARPNQPR